MGLILVLERQESSGMITLGEEYFTFKLWCKMLMYEHPKAKTFKKVFVVHNSFHAFSTVRCFASPLKVCHIYFSFFGYPFVSNISFDEM